MQAFYSILKDVRAKVPPSMFMTEGAFLLLSSERFSCSPRSVSLALLGAFLSDLAHDLALLTSLMTMLS